MNKQGCNCKKYVNGRCIGEGKCELEAELAKSAELIFALNNTRPDSHDILSRLTALSNALEWAEKHKNQHYVELLAHETVGAGKLNDKE